MSKSLGRLTCALTHGRAWVLGYADNGATVAARRSLAGSLGRPPRGVFVLVATMRQGWGQKLGTFVHTIVPFTSDCRKRLEGAGKGMAFGLVRIGMELLI